MPSSKSRYTLSLAACIGVALLLLSGNAMAGITASHSPVLPTYALQVGGAGVTYTITPAASFTRQIQATRNQYNAPNSSFLLRVDLQSGFVFANGGLPKPTDISYTSTPAGGINVAGVEIYDGGQAGDPYVRYYIPTSAGTGVAFTSATLTITPNNWKITDQAGYLTGGHTVVKYMDVQALLFDAGNATQFDDSFVEPSDTAHLFRVANGVEAAVADLGHKLIDLETTRLNFVGHDKLFDDTSALDLQPAPGVLGLNGAQYVFGTEVGFVVTISGNLSGIVDCRLNPGLPTERVSSTCVFNIPGTPTPWTGFGGYIRVKINVNGTTPLDSRTLNVTITDTTNHAPIISNDTQLASTPLTVWAYKGSLLVSSYANANTNNFRTRFYVWNYDEDASSILVRVMTLPINGNTTPSVALGLGQVVYRYNVPGHSGLTIRLEDVLADVGAAGPQLGPDSNGNMYVEFSFGSERVTGWTQTFDVTGTSFMGLIEMSSTPPYTR
jgi:hypothetical protein